MHLEKIELQGFKSFAERTILEFPAPKDHKKSITIIVGPNGSGKSNVADAIKWVLGEQSMKTIRGKHSQDVIFSGSEKRSRLGFAQVSLYLNNTDGQAPIEYSELVISRRLYRDGQSEYLLNKNPVRLIDIQLLLAKMHFGQKSFSIISQGMVDSVLLSTPLERKNFFDEAVGVKEFQIKRRHSLLKLQRSEEHLEQANTLLKEIEPQLRSLTRQVKKLEQRQQVQASLREYQQEYYHRLWSGLRKTKTDQGLIITELQNQKTEIERQLADKRIELESIEKGDTRSQIFGQLQADLHAQTQEKHRLLREMTVLKGRLEVDFEKQGKLNLAWLYRQEEEISQRLLDTQKELDALRQEHGTVTSTQKNNSYEAQTLKDTIEELSKRIEVLKDEIKSQVAKGPLTIISRRVKELVITYQKFINRLRKAPTDSAEYLTELHTQADMVMAQLHDLGNTIASSVDNAVKEEQVKKTESQELWQWQQQLNAAILQHEKFQQQHNQSQIKSQVLTEKIRIKERDQVQLQQELKRITQDLSAQQQAEQGSVDTNKIKEQQEAVDRETESIDRVIAELEGKIRSFNEEQEEKQSTVFRLEREYQTLQQQINAIQQKLHTIQVELARSETKLEDLETEIKREMGEITVVEKRPDNTDTDLSTFGQDHLFAQIEKCKYQLDLIGGIDPQTVEEYQQVKARYDHLDHQIRDLDEAMKKLEQIIQELDKNITNQFDQAFQHINKEFERYFQILFGGGRAKLIKIEQEQEVEVETPSAETAVEAIIDEQSSTRAKKYQRSDFQGIDIYASPAGKKLSTISMLSGGERTLTSLALIAAIINHNPSPFVLMDEVDAALDEANSQRMARVIEDLRDKTQFLIITHNRTVMNIGDTIYGVTMKQEGVSHLLSVKLEDLQKHAARL